MLQKQVLFLELLPQFLKSSVISTESWRMFSALTSVSRLKWPLSLFLAPSSVFSSESKMPSLESAAVSSGKLGDESRQRPAWDLLLLFPSNSSAGVEVFGPSLRQPTEPPSKLEASFLLSSTSCMGL